MKGDCHKCKYETSAECVPRSQKLEYPNCYQSTVTHYDRLVSKTPEELAEFLTTEDMCELICAPVPPHCDGQCKQKMLDWLKQETKPCKEKGERNGIR